MTRSGGGGKQLLVTRSSGRLLSAASQLGVLVRGIKSEVVCDSTVS